MLIIPLHQPLTRKHFPWMTAVLILVNVFVFFALQGRDRFYLESAAEVYASSGLAREEFPLLVKHLERWRSGEIANQLKAQPEGRQRARLMAEVLAYDPTFNAVLETSPPYDKSSSQHTDWQRRRAVFDDRLSRVFTPRHVLSFQEPSIWRHLSSMFLHADFGHLLGNMIFLALLGLMVESTLGAPLFLAVYLLGGFGGGLISALRHLDEFGFALGASGAIAGLMGAMCVLWGKRKVRVFYWFFVIFDYVRIPAISLLPIWLGWELWQLWAHPDAGVGFDAHAGGIVTGALAALAVRKLGWERKSVLDAQRVVEDKRQLEGTARTALGKLDFQTARELTRQLVAMEPKDRFAWTLRMRAWRHLPRSPEFHECVRSLLLEALVPRATLDEEIALFEEYCAACPDDVRLTDEELCGFADRWLQGHRLAPADRLIVNLLELPESSAAARKLAVRLALQHQERNDTPAFQRVAGRLYARFPNSEETHRLQRLLASG